MDLRIALLASFTVEPLVPYLGLALDEAGLAGELHVGPYSQIAQECLNPSSRTASMQPDVVVIWPRLEDLWGAKPLPLTDTINTYIEELDDLVASALAVRQWGATPLFVLPAIPEVRPLGVGDASNSRGVFAAATAAREAARARLASSPGVLVADAEEVVRTLGTATAIDWRRFAIARIPYQETAFALMGERLATLIHLSRRGAKKVVAVDADNTLWGGVVGEDGVDGIDLLDNGVGEAFRDFQRYLLELRRAGAILALVSKNNEADVWAAFQRGEMRLRQSDFAAWRINWAPKSTSLAEIASELNLSTEAVVFVDDSAIERGQVSSALPEVRTVEMPSDPALWYQAMASGGLDRLPPTKADLSRADSYERESERRMLRETVSLGEFLGSLDLRVEVARIQDGDVPRAAQLIAKTNQFTLGGHRRSNAELIACLEDPRYEARTVSAADRFGDYGAIGVFIVDRAPAGAADPGQAAVLDTFTLSCRAMGRGIETAMVAAAFEAADKPLCVVVHEAPKNAPARAFFAELGATETGTTSRLPHVSWPAHITRTGSCQPAPA